MLMRKKRNGGVSEQQETATASERVKSNGAERTDSVGNGRAGARDGEPQARLAGTWQLPGSFRELGSAIFSTANPVQAGAELLDPGDKKADATRLNALKTFAEWVFGKPGGEPQRRPPRVIWDIPCPPYEPVDPVEPQDLEGGEE
jgi:hypothetical protein